MKRTFFFAIIALTTIVIISSLTNFAYAVQPDYDTMVTNTTFSSNYDRIFDGQKFVNYLSNNTANQIVFQSRNIVLKFDKNLCSFQLLNPITNTVSIPNYSQSLTIDGIEPVLSACSVTNYARTENGLSFIAMRSGIGGNISTTYVIDAVGHLEWTYEITNTDLLKTSKYGVIETCDNCVGTSLDNDMISFGDYIYDTKNRIHNTLKSTDNTKGDYTFMYEGDAISFGEKIIIDPSFDTGVGSGNDASVVITVGSNPDRLLVAHVGYGRTANLSVSSVKIGSTAFTKLVTSNSTSPELFEYTDVWYLVNPPTGSQTIDVLYNGAPNYKAVSAISLYNVHQTLPIGVYNTTAGTNQIPNTVQIIPINTGSFIFAVGQSELSMSNPNKTAIYTNVADGGGDFVVAAQYANASSTFINAVNTFSWAPGGTTLAWSAVAVEVRAPIINAVTVLIALQITGHSVTLDWDQPLGSTIITGYQINDTTPWANPLTIITNDTGSTTTTGTVSGLTELTQYSFRVAPWSSIGNNATGKILNVTTLKEVGVGTLNITGTNPNLIPILFERNDINDTALFLNFTYSNAFTLSCDLHYKFAQANQTYTSVSSITIDSTKHSAFQFNNVTNEIIDVFCWNQADGAMNSTNVNSTNSGRYLITQTNFLLLQQIANFKSGVYGTSGQFGILDFSTLVIIILSMVGLNRVNESVGGIFVVGIVGVAWFFGIVDLTNFIIAGIALTVLLIVGTTKKD